jgi:hypothetical protein
VPDAGQRPCGHGRQPIPVDVAYDCERAHPVPIPRDRLPRVCRVRQASLADPEFFGPAGPAGTRRHRRDVSAWQSRRRGQGIQADRRAADGKPMRKASASSWVRTQSAQQCRQAQAIELRQAQQP